MNRTLRPLVILGPTAGGKSELAVRLAEMLAAVDGRPGEVIGADSMQVYRHMDAGTAKPTADQRRRAVHHLIDIVEPTERFTVADWLARADALIERLIGSGVRPIVVGGTNLYIRALLEGLFEGPPADAAFRSELAKVDVHALHRRLAKVDAVAAERIDPNDRRRITRALEVLHTTGKPISAWQQQWEEPGRGKRGSGEAAKRETTRDTGHGTWDTGHGTRDSRFRTRDTGHGTTTYRHNPILLGLHWPAEAINPRINLRVKAMFFPDKVEPALAAEVCIGGRDLVAETRELEAADMLGPQAREALGYKQVLAHLQGRCTLEEAFEQTKIQTRRFARQQRTWLKRFRSVQWLDAQTLSPQELANAAIQTVDANR